MSEEVISVARDLSRARYDLEAFLLAGPFDLFEDHAPLGLIDADHSAIEVSFNKLIFQCWGEGWSRSWKVLGYSIDRVQARLHCSKQIGLKHSVLELRRGELDADAPVGSRREFATDLARRIESSLPRIRVEHAIAARDDREHLSGVYARLVLRSAGKLFAGIGVAESEPQPLVDGILSAGLIWREALKHSNGDVEGLMIFVPRGRSTTISTRLTALQSAGIAIYQFDGRGAIDAIAAFDQGDLADNLQKVTRRAIWPTEVPVPGASADLYDSILELAPDMIEAVYRQGYFTFAILGLEFARLSVKRAEVYFGVSDKRKRLDPRNRAELALLVDRIVSVRTGAMADATDELYRLYAERWLECLIRKNVTALDPTLHPRFVYSQVPTYRGEQRTFIDLLTATRDGRLVIIEVKVSENVEFPFQALDYWLRVEWHRVRGDFEKRGLFRGLNLADAPPLLYLVAPLFRFHATTKQLAGHIAGRVPVYRIGINDDWRRALRILLSERLN